jgi:glutamyl-tRNA reductase
MDDLRRFVEAGLSERRREVAAVETILEEELDRFVAVSSSREVAPLVTALRDRAETVRAAELIRFTSRLQGLDDEQAEAVDALTRAIVAKLVHEPTIALKEAAGSPRGERLAESLRDLYDL